MDTTADKAMVGAVLCPPVVLDTTRALMILGALYTMERLVDATNDSLLEIFQAISTIGTGENAPLRFEWSNGSIVTVVPDMVQLALEAPEVAKTLGRMERAGFAVKNEVTIS